MKQAREAAGGPPAAAGEGDIEDLLGKHALLGLEDKLRFSCTR
jgi:hypothetical protein